MRQRLHPFFTIRDPPHDPQVSRRHRQAALQNERAVDGGRRDLRTRHDDSSRSRDDNGRLGEPRRRRADRRGLPLVATTGHPQCTGGLTFSHHKTVAPFGHGSPDIVFAREVAERIGMSGTAPSAFSIVPRAHRIRDTAARPRRLALRESTIPPRSPSVIDDPGDGDQRSQARQQECIERTGDEPQYDRADDRNGGCDERQGRTPRWSPRFRKRQRFVVRHWFRVGRPEFGAGNSVPAEVGDSLGGEKR